MVGDTSGMTRGVADPLVCYADQVVNGNDGVQYTTATASSLAALARIPGTAAGVRDYNLFIYHYVTTTSFCIITFFFRHDNYYIESESARQKYDNGCCTYFV